MGPITPSFGEDVKRQGSHRLGKPLNFYASPSKVLEFSSTLNVVAWKVFLMLFGCPRQKMKCSSENLKVIYTKCLIFYVIINYQFRTSELKNEDIRID